MSSSEPDEEFDAVSDSDPFPDDDFDNDDDQDANAETAVKESNFAVLTVSDIIDEQLNHINRIVELLEVPPATARQLLTYMKWNVDKLIDMYYGGASVFKESGIADPRESNSAMNTRKKNKDGTEECTICFVDYKPEEMGCLPCGHNFCVGCWVDYLTVKIKTDGNVKSITCPAKGCIMLVDEVTITNILKDKALLDRYNHFVAEAYVADNANVRWCPGKNCDKIIRVRLLKDKHVICSSCHTTFCFGCGLSPHAPADCRMVRQWEQKTAQEGESSLWMAKYTKECPKCNVLIQKDHGCQYMACSNCSHKFCWVCLGAFDHAQHNCGAYKEEVGADAKRTALHKFMHFYTRYQVHQQAAQFEDRLLAQAERIMEQEAEKGTAWIDLQYIIHATIQLTQARVMLKYSYVYGYYLPPHVNRELFEFLQADLETQTELLSQILEAKGEREKIKIIHAAEQVKGRVKKLLEGLADGDITGGNTVEKLYDGAKFESYDGWIYKA